MQVDEGRSGYQVHLQLPPGSIKCDRDRPLLLHWVGTARSRGTTDRGHESDPVVGWGEQGLFRSDRSVWVMLDGNKAPAGTTFLDGE